MLRRLPLVLAAVTVGALGVPAGAAPADAAALVLSGSGSVQTTFVLGKQRNMSSEPLVLTGGRDYVAVDLRHSDGRHGAQAAVVRAFGPEHARQVEPGTDYTLAAGRYTLTLIADGPASVTIRFPQGSGTQRLRATRRVDSALQTGATALAPVSGAARVVLPGAVPAGRSAFLLRFLSSDARGGRLEHCATPARSCQQSPLSVDYSAAGIGGTIMRDVAAEPVTRNAVTAVDGVRSAGDLLRVAALSYG